MGAQVQEDHEPLCAEGPQGYLAGWAGHREAVQAIDAAQGEGTSGHYPKCCGNLFFGRKHKEEAKLDCLAALHQLELVDERDAPGVKAEQHVSQHKQQRQSEQVRDRIFASCLECACADLFRTRYAAPSPAMPSRARQQEQQSSVSSSTTQRVPVVDGKAGSEPCLCKVWKKHRCRANTQRQSNCATRSDSFIQCQALLLLLLYTCLRPSISASLGRPSESANMLSLSTCMAWLLIPASFNLL